MSHQYSTRNHLDRYLLITLLLLSRTSLSALGVTPTELRSVENQARGSFVDATDNSTQPNESNFASVMVVEVVGMTRGATTTMVIKTGNPTFITKPESIDLKPSVNP